MSNEFFEKLNKGMNIETKSIEQPTEEPLEERPAEEPLEEQPVEESPKEPEAELMSAPVEPEIISKPVRKKRSSKKKTAKKKKNENKIEVKQESSFDEEYDKDSSLQKEGQLTVDVFETEKNIIIQSAVAGVEPEDLDISIEKDMVSIRGTRERRIEEKTENFFHQECFWGRFSREIVLPSEVDKNKAEAAIKNGVLTIKIPKINTSKSKKLNISVED
jgi:HSP20 family protein